MDSLERKYELLQAEATSWRTRAESLEAANGRLSQQLTDLEARLQAAEKKSITYILPLDQKTSGIPELWYSRALEGIVRTIENIVHWTSCLYLLLLLLLQYKSSISKWFTRSVS